MFIVIVSDCDGFMYFDRYKTLEEAKRRVESEPYNESTQYWLAEMIGEYVPVPNIVWEVIPEEEEDTEEEEE